MIARLLFHRTLRAQLHDEVLKGYSAVKSKPFLERKQVDGIAPFRVLTVDIHPLKVAPSPTLADDVPTPLKLEHDRAKTGHVNHHRASYDGIQYLHYISTEHNLLALSAIQTRCAGKSEWSSSLLPGRLSQPFKKSLFCNPADNAPHVVIASDKSVIQDATFSGVPVIRCCPKYMAENNGALRQLVDDAITTNLVEKMNSATWTSAYWLGATIGGVSAIFALGWSH